MKRRGFMLLEMLLVVMFLMVMALLLVPGTARAEDPVTSTPAVVSEPAPAAEVVNPVQNPFVMLATEIFTWIASHNVGVSGYYSQAQDTFKPTLSVQLVETPHKWLSAGVGIAVDDFQNLDNIGGYIGLNGKKVIEKVKGSPCVIINSLTIGYFEGYYFSGIKDTNGKEKDWDGGVFGIMVTVPLPLKTK